MQVKVNVSHSTTYGVEGASVSITGSKYFLHINKRENDLYTQAPTLPLEIEEAKELIVLLQAYLQEISNADLT